MWLSGIHVSLDHGLSSLYQTRSYQKKRTMRIYFRELAYVVGAGKAGQLEALGQQRIL